MDAMNLRTNASLQVDSPATDLVALLRARATLEPDRFAYHFLSNSGNQEASLTYQELDRRARAIAAQLQVNHAAGERALLLFQPGFDYLAAFFACLYAQVIAVPGNPPRRAGPSSRLQAIVEN